MLLTSSKNKIIWICASRGIEDACRGRKGLAFFFSKKEKHQVAVTICNLLKKRQLSAARNVCVHFFFKLRAYTQNKIIYAFTCIKICNLIMQDCSTFLTERSCKIVGVHVITWSCKSTFFSFKCCTPYTFLKCVKNAFCALGGHPPQR